MCNNLREQAVIDARKREGPFVEIPLKVHSSGPANDFFAFYLDTIE